MYRGFAPVTPIWLLQKMGPLDAGRYHLPLAHDVLKWPEEYRKFFHNMGVSMSGRTVIMDNSVVELGASVKVDKLLEACEICEATHMVLPDSLLDGQGTVALSYAAWSESLGRSRIPRIAVVPQGQSLGEWVSCAEMLAERIKIDLWCIPRNFENRLGARYAAAKILQAIKNIPIHLIGFSDWIYADIVATQHPNVIGIDSAVPIRIGQTGEDLMMGVLYKSREGWFDSVRPDTPLDMAVLRNMQRVRKWLNP